MLAVGEMAAWRRFKGRQLLPGAAVSEIRAEAPSYCKGWWSWVGAAGTNSPEGYDCVEELPSSAAAGEGF